MKIVVTAGPTREPIDPVRYLSNRSSGKMGYAIAAAAIERGHDLLLISGPVNIPAPIGARVVSVLTSDDMYEAVRTSVTDCDALIMCAAVANYKPAEYSAQKLKKHDAPLSLSLVPTRDILATISRGARRFLVIGFAAETENVEGNAQKKLLEKSCDAIIANDVSRDDSGFESDENEVVILTKEGVKKYVPRTSKHSLGRTLIEIVESLHEKNLTIKF